MVHHLEGSQQLKDSLPYGSITRIAETFGVSTQWVKRVVVGEYYNEGILKCAHEISLLAGDYKTELNKILDEYRR